MPREIGNIQIQVVIRQKIARGQETHGDSGHALIRGARIERAPSRNRGDVAVEAHTAHPRVAQIGDIDVA